MARRVSRIYGGEPILNIFEFNKNVITDPELNVLDFGNDISEDWARFVMNNRNKNNDSIGDRLCNQDNKYDIVIDPVAYDDMALLFRQFENKIITFEMLMKGMEFRKSTDQYSFHTIKAVSYLKKVGERNVN